MSQQELAEPLYQGRRGTEVSLCQAGIRHQESLSGGDNTRAGSWREEQVNLGRIVWGPGKNFHTEAGTCASYRGVNFSGELWWWIMKNYLAGFSHCCPVATQAEWKIKNFQAGGGEAEKVQNPAKPAWDLFLGVASFLFLFFPVGAIRKMKEAECTCLGIAVMWNPILSLEALAKTSPCTAFLCGDLQLLREGRPQLQDQSLCWLHGSGWSTWAECPVGMTCFSPLCASRPWLLRSGPAPALSN